MMEAINNMANSASKAIWGENNPNNREEPISGVKGDTSQGEPYDAGNMETPKQRESLEGHSRLSENPAPTASTPSEKPDGPKGTRDEENPATKTTTDGQNVTTGGAGVGNAGENFKDPGPRPLEKVAKQHGGDAGNRDKDTNSKGGGVGDDAATTSSKSSSNSSTSDEEDGIQKKSHGSGTGEKYVKSSGLRADGGDFDAAKPGAGREADRIMGEKGIHQPASESSKSEGPDETNDKEGKRSLGQKIKDKLHRH